MNESDAQVKSASDPDRIIHTRNGITHQNLLSSRTVRIRHKEVSVWFPMSYPMIELNIQPDLMISTGVVLAPQALNLPVVQEIFADAASNNMGTNRTLRQVIRTGIDGTTPVPSVISGTSTPSPSGISKTNASPPSGGLWSPRTGNIRKSTSPNFRKSNAAIDRNFSNDPIAPLVRTKVFGDKLSNSYIRYLYTRCRVKLAT